MLETLVAHWGYWAIGVGTFFEGESILIAAGALAHRGLLSLPIVVLVAFLGSLIGDQAWFQLGRHFGPALLERRPEWKTRVGTVQRRLDRYGTTFVFGFRFIYGLRTVTPALLGLTGYPARRFVFLNVAGAALWAIVFGAAGWGLGAALTRLLRRAAHLEELLGCAVVLTVAAWLVWRQVQRRLSDDPPD